MTLDYAELRREYAKKNNQLNKRYGDKVEVKAKSEVNDYSKRRDELFKWLINNDDVKKLK